MESFSVIIPTFNRTQLFFNTVESVLAQSYSDYEIIVVDDNPADSDVSSEIKHFCENISAIRYIDTRGFGNGAKARNYGLSKAQGKYVTFLDDDDVYHVDFLSNSLYKLEGSKIQMTACMHFRLYGRMIYFRSNFSAKTDDLVFALLSGELSIPTSTLAFKTDFIRSLGGFDESFLRHQDLELLLRVFKKTEDIDFINRPLVYMNTAGHRNYPTGKTSEEIKRSFFQKFSLELSDLKQVEFARVQRYQYQGVAGFYLKGLDIKNFIRVMRKYVYGVRFMENIAVTLKVVVMSQMILRIPYYAIMNIYFKCQKT